MVNRIPALRLAAVGVIHLALAAPASAAGPIGVNGPMSNGLAHNGLTYNGLHPNGSSAHDAPSDAELRFSPVEAFDFNAVEALEIELPDGARPAANHP